MWWHERVWAKCGSWGNAARPVPLASSQHLLRSESFLHLLFLKSPQFKIFLKAASLGGSISWSRAGIQSLAETIVWHLPWTIEFLKNWSVFFLSFSFSFILFMASLEAYGSSWARGWIGAATLAYTAVTAMPGPSHAGYRNARSLTQGARPGIRLISSWTLCHVLNLLSRNGTSRLGVLKSRNAVFSWPHPWEQKWQVLDFMCGCRTGRFQGWCQSQIYRSKWN